MSAEPNAAQLSFWEKLTYGVGDVAHSAGPGTIAPFWYLVFLTGVARLKPALAGLTVLFWGHPGRHQRSPGRAVVRPYAHAVGASVPLTRERHRSIQAHLAGRRAGTPGP